MNDQIVLICATGRSGSTTLQRIINTIPRSNICGENHGAINNLLEFYYNLHIATSEHIPGRYNPKSYNKVIYQRHKPAWYNSYKISEIEDCVRQTIIKMFKKNEYTNLWGFKEIRYSNNRIKLLKFFKYLFPQTKIIIQIREDIVKQSKSAWHKYDPTSKEKLQKSNDELKDFYNKNKSWCYFTTFERMFDKKNIYNIFKFIDCDKYYNEEEIDKILKNNME